MKLLDRHICLTDKKTLILMIIFIIMFSTVVLASVWNNGVNKIPILPKEKPEMWIPTVEDIAYQDSMYMIIQSTQDDINDIKNDIVHILERLDYADGTWDSIRYVKGGTIDKRRNKID